MMATYPQSEIILTVDLVKFKKIAAQPNFQPRIKLKLGDYMFNSDFMVLDIINSNLYTRPVYFASDHELFADYLQIQGLVNQFLPLDPRMDDPAVSIAKTKKYLHKIYKTTPSNDFSSGLVPDITNDGMAYNLYGYVARSYLLRKEVDSAVYTIDQLFKAYNNNLPFTLNQNHIAAVLLDAGHVTEGTKLLMDYIETMYQLYRKPSSNSPYISRKTVLDRAVAVQAILLDKKLDTKRIDEILGALERELY
jgi:hypothetical protein